MPKVKSPLDTYYQRLVRKMVIDAKDRQEQPFAYRDLADRLREHGIHIDHQVLINKIRRGTFSFAFALQVLAALGETKINIPKLTSKKELESLK